MSEEEERPYKAEYAKSGRAGCKLCKGNISKDTLRMAKMVQSPFFDGKQPNWYHNSCFFKVCQLKSVSEVSGFGTLRWDDQEKLKGKASGGGGADSTDGPTTSGKGKGKRKTTRSDLTVEYAKSNRSSCKGCNSQIDKGDIRISKMVQPDLESSARAYAGLIPHWHHIDCFLELLPSLEAEGVAADELSGFTKLKKPDKDELKKKFVEMTSVGGGSEDVDGGGGGGKGKGKGKKRKAEEPVPPAVKKSKDEVKQETALKKQNKEIWRVRDELKASLSNSDLKALLMANSQHIPIGESKLLDSCADGMVFGALKPCPECSGQLMARSHCYQCTGNMSAWSKCTHTTADPDRKKWVIPSDLEDVPCLSKFKCKVGQRLFDKEMTPPQSSASSSVAMDTTDGPAPSLAGKVDVPLRGFRVFIIGRLSRTKPVLTREIESLGGKVVSKVSKTTTICISDQAEVDKLSKRMAEVEEAEVPVVSDGYLEDATKGGALLKIPQHTISPWGAARTSLPANDDVIDKASGKSFKSTAHKVKLTVKGGAAVDPESELEDTHHVLQDKAGVLHTAVLGLVDITRGTNSYYKLQLLEGDSSKSYYVFRSWGRVGTTIGGCKVEPFGMSKERAKQHFYALYLEKTGNEWPPGDSGSFQKHPGKFYPLEIDYGQEEEEVAKLSAGDPSSSSSSLAPEVQSLVRLIFDVESMKKTMMEFEIDIKKMPLGKLSQRQIRSAYSVLTELLAEIKGGRSASKILDASNRFYTLIPHDFGLLKPPPLDNEVLIGTKTQMLDNLLEIEVAYSLLKQEGGGAKKDPIDAHYEKLKTDMEVVPRDSAEFAMLQEYTAATHAATHNQYTLELLDVFKIVRRGELKRYKPFSKLHNRQLLWHGSRTTNYAGILSQGLRIAPPEAPVTGYMFGKGIYFADMVSKSANYCRTSRSEPTGLMLLCEVALGDMYELTHSEYVNALPPGKHSTKGLGRTEPDPSGSIVSDSGAVVPKGKGAPSSATNTSLLYNEYIVYDVSQIHMKYLLKMDFKHKW